MQTGNTDFIYRNELDKACFQHVMAYGKSKDLIEITQSNKVLRDKAFEIANDPKYDGYQTGLASMGYKFFDKKFIYLLETIFGIWDVDLADMQSLSLINLKKKKKKKKIQKEENQINYGLMKVVNFTIIFLRGI